MDISLSTTIAPEISVGRFTLRPMENAVWIDGVRVELSRTEADILFVLMTNARRVVPFARLREELLRPNQRGRGSLAVHVHHLRDKIETSAGRPRHIVTIRGRGYRFQP